jgi:hypothetical protein
VWYQKSGLGLHLMGANGNWQGSWCVLLLELSTGSTVLYPHHHTLSRMHIIFYSITFSLKISKFVGAGSSHL